MDFRVRSAAGGSAHGVAGGKSRGHSRCGTREESPACDALEFIMAGASAVQIGTANFIDPAVSQKVVEGLEAYCRDHGLASLEPIRGII